MTDYNLQQRVRILQEYACHPKTDGAAFYVEWHVSFITGPLYEIQCCFREDLCKHKSCLEKDEPVMEGYACFQKHACLPHMCASSFASYYVLRMYVYKIKVHKKSFDYTTPLAFNCKSYAYQPVNNNYFFSRWGVGRFLLIYS